MGRGRQRSLSQISTSTSSPKSWECHDQDPPHLSRSSHGSNHHHFPRGICHKRGSSDAQRSRRPERAQSQGPASPFLLLLLLWLLAGFRLSSDKDRYSFVSKQLLWTRKVFSLQQEMRVQSLLDGEFLQGSSFRSWLVGRGREQLRLVHSLRHHRGLCGRHSRRRYRMGF